MNAIATICLLVATLFWWLGIHALVRGRRSRSWPTAKGTIDSARVHKKYNSKGREVWRHQVEYSYSVGDTRFRGTRIRFGIPQALLWFQPSDPTFQQFRRGARVIVYHSPGRPSLCTLQPVASAFSFVTLAGGGLLAWIAFQFLQASAG